MEKNYDFKIIESNCGGKEFWYDLKETLKQNKKKFDNIHK